MSMYVRVKRHKQTIFLYTEPTETVADLKKKVAEINGLPPARTRLLYGDTVMDESRTIGDHKIENEKVIYLVHKKDGSEEWEPVDIHKPDDKKETHPIV